MQQDDQRMSELAEDRPDPTRAPIVNNPSADRGRDIMTLNESYTKNKNKKANPLGGHLGEFVLYLKFAWTDYKRRKCLSFIAIFAITMCVVLTMVAQGIITKIPIIFYNNAVNTNGDLDAIITPQYDTDRLNATQIRTILNKGNKDFIDIYRSQITNVPISASYSILKDAIDRKVKQTVTQVTIEFIDI